MRLLSFEHILQTQFVFGEELYDELCEKSSALFKGIIADHPFVDSNKRTAMLAGLTFLGANNIHFLGKKGSIENYAVKIAVEHLTIKEIASWLKQNCRLAI